MEAGALFILVVLFAAIAVAAAAVYAIAMVLRAKKLDPEGDKIEGEDAKRERGRRGSHQPSPPEHLRVESEQRARSFGAR